MEAATARAWRLPASPDTSGVRRAPTSAEGARRPRTPHQLSRARVATGQAMRRLTEITIG